MSTLIRSYSIDLVISGLQRRASPLNIKMLPKSTSLSIQLNTKKNRKSIKGMESSNLKSKAS